MSHEGIKFGDPNAPERDGPEIAQGKLHLSAEAVTPKAVRIHLTDGSGLEIDWKDGHHSLYAFKWLRDACPCALCNEKREQQGRQPGEPEPVEPVALPMFKAPPLPEEVIPVGRYAISFRWNDGHQHGIYSWEYLRRCAPGT